MLGATNRPMDQWPHDRHLRRLPDALDNLDLVSGLDSRVQSDGSLFSLLPAEKLDFPAADQADSVTREIAWATRGVDGGHQRQIG